MAISRYFPYAFGVDADDLTSIPDAAAVDGSVSYQEGWTVPYQYNLLTNPSALPIPRGQMNELFYDITLNIKQYQEYGTPEWYSGVSYPIYARVYYNNLVYQNLVASNTATPGTDLTWQLASIGQIINVSSNTTLPSSAYGAKVNCTGGTAYAITLPAASDGGFIDFFVNTSSFALVTLTPPAGTIQGRSNFILGFMESCRVYSDGSNYFVQLYMMQPSSYLVSLTSGQSIPANTNTKVNFDNVQFNYGGTYDNVTNFRWTPNYPGQYKLYSTLRFELMSNNNVVIKNQIYINGVLRNEGVTSSESPAMNLTESAPTSQTISMNGSTDYVEIFVDHNDATGHLLYNDVIYCFAGGERINNFY